MNNPSASRSMYAVFGGTSNVLQGMGAVVYSVFFLVAAFFLLHRGFL